jgi:sugar/nucleoside kinase (ribokinase family)
LPGIDWRVVEDGQTTSFENRYEGARRTQCVLTPARPLGLDDIAGAWRVAPIVLFAPVFHDVEPELPRRLWGHGPLIGLSAQGWLRRTEGDRVLPGIVEPRPAWLTGDVVFVSDEDVADAESARVWQKQVPVVVLTRARRGCTVWDSHGRHDLSAVTTREVDPTGAGDVFAAAFLIRLKESGDTLSAARFASAAAALAVREVGLGGIGSRSAIEALLSIQEPATSR